MDNILFNINYRPLKIGFLIKGKKISSLAKVVELNTMLWGGIFNPIIPYTNNKKKLLDYISRFNIDVLFEVDENGNETLVESIKYLEQPFTIEKKIFYKESPSNKYVSSFLSIDNAIKYLYEKEFKHKTNNYRSNYSFIEWENNDPLKNVFAVIFGNYPDNEELKFDYKKNYKRLLHAPYYSILKDENIDRKLSYSHSPIELTSFSMTGVNRSGGFFVGNNSFLDLINFWNLRASGKNVKYISINHIERFKDYINEHINELETYLKDLKFFNQIEVSYCSVKEEIFNNILKKFSSKYNFCLSYCNFFHKFSMDILPVNILQTDDIISQLYQVGERKYFTIKLPEKFFYERREFDIYSQRLAIDISTFSEPISKMFTFQVPNLPQLNEQFARIIGDIYLWDIRLNNNGISIVIKGSDRTIDISPIPFFHIIKILFEYAGMKINLSQPGLLCKKLIEQFGSIDARVLKIKGVRNLIYKLKVDSYVNRAEAKRIIWDDGNFSKYRDLYIERRENLDLTNDQVFDFLLKKNLFRAGIEIVCSECRISNWYSLKEIDDFLICKYCGFNNQSSLHIKNRGDWKFRKSGLFSKDNKQEGSIPVILTLQQLSVLKGILSTFIYTESLNTTFGEIDFCVYDAKNNEIGIGECKSENGIITAKEVRRMVRIKKAFKSVGIHCVLIFSKTATEFTKKEINLFKKYSTSEYDDDIILFTNKELEVWDFYFKTKFPSTIPHSRPYGLSEIARNSKFFYLNEAT